MKFVDDDHVAQVQFPPSLFSFPVSPPFLTPSLLSPLFPSCPFQSLPFLLSLLPFLLLIVPYLLEVGPLNPAIGGLGERCKLPQRGLGQSPSRILCILPLKYIIW